MITDRAIITAMFTRAGIPFTVSPFEGSPHLPAVTTCRVLAGQPILGLPDDAHAHCRQTFGYTDFYIDFYFDAADTLINLGAYE